MSSFTKEKIAILDNCKDGRGFINFNESTTEVTEPSTSPLIMTLKVLVKLQKPISSMKLIKPD